MRAWWRKQGGCLQPAGKEAQVWDTIGQPVVMMIEGSGKAKSRQESRVFLPLAVAVISTTKAYEETL